nr:immunoglobulin heavy chain junction region [Macaca mulatta]MOX01022.1 immunoglobulin heavy chain junction region [Macaca mulatta]
CSRGPDYGLYNRFDVW